MGPKWFALITLSCALGACAGKKSSSGFGDPNGDKGGATPDGPALANGNGVSNCGFTDDIDHDGDGLSFKQGDCDDCDPNVNPGAFDVPHNGWDEDCNGHADDDGIACDSGMAVDSQDPFAAARVLGLCRKAEANARGWGVLEARWVTPDGQPLDGHPESYGMLTSFGANRPQEGGFMLALSSGCARAPGQPGACDDSPEGHDKGYICGHPPGYPKESRACPGLVSTGDPHDGVGLQLKVRVPSNAKSFTMQENFFTFEFPMFICSEYNDFFVAMMTPKVPSLPDGNIAFDQDGNPISVNNSLLQVCAPQWAGFKNFGCPLGPSSLARTGFDGHAATGWLQTQAAVTPGSEVTLLFTIWDSGDGALDSTVLLDKFAWSAEPLSGATTTPAPAK